MILLYCFALFAVALVSPYIIRRVSKKKRWVLCALIVIACFACIWVLTEEREVEKARQNSEELHAVSVLNEAMQEPVPLSIEEEMQEHDQFLQDLKRRQRYLEPLRKKDSYPLMFPFTNFAHR